MLEFEVRLHVENDTLEIRGPIPLIIERPVQTIEDMCKVFQEYLTTFSQNFDYYNYRINKNDDKYDVMKDIGQEQKEWSNVGTFNTYFQAFEAMCDDEYKSSKCLAGYTDCICGKDTDYYDEERCKECVANGECYYDDECK